MKNKEFNIIHIGMPKVATTTLQNKIFPIIAKKLQENYFIQRFKNNFRKIKFD